jgi:hypothetical protein
VRDEAAEAAVAADVRRRLFTVGWLTDPWDSLIKDAARRIGPDATGQLDSARALYAQLSAASSSDDALLDRWAASVADEGVGSYQAGRMWQEVLASLREDQEVALTGRIQVQGDRNLEITRSQFFDGLDAAGDVDALFTAGVLSDVAATANASRMVQCERFSNPSRLSRDLVVTWFSAPIASWDFALSDDRQPEASPAHADYTIPSMARLDAAPASPGPAPDDAGDWQMPAAPPGW